MKNNSNRFRCTVVGCNPKLYGQESADGHNKETGHRTAKWPVRSAEGQRKARERNKNGYYDKYNVGAKSAVARGLVEYVDQGEDDWWGTEESALFLDFDSFEDPWD